MGSSPMNSLPRAELMLIQRECQRMPPFVETLRTSQCGPTPNRWTVKCLCFLSSPKSLWSQKLPLRRRRRGVAACPAR